nr:methyltransferase [Limnochorda pilosa]
MGAFPALPHGGLGRGREGPLPPRVDCTRSPRCAQRGTGRLIPTTLQIALPRAPVLQDLPGVLDLNRAQGREWPGVTSFPGDFLEVLPEGPFDLAYLGNVTHIYGAEENVALLTRLRERQPVGGMVAINDFVRGRSPRAPLFALQMLLSTHQGGVRSEAEYRAWLERAGYEDVRVEDRPGGVKQLVLAQRGP